MDRFTLLGVVALVGCGQPPPVTIEAAPEPTIEAAVAQEREAPPARVLPQDAALIGLAEVLPEVSEAVVRSVVSVSTLRAGIGRRGWPGSPPPLQQGVGSGVIVGSDGIVVTNNHVVAGAERVVVALPDGRQTHAEVVGTDPKTDLAVLRLVDAPPDLIPLSFGDSDGLRLGEVVLAVGNPFGIGQTVTMGIVSAKGRADVGIVDYEDFIQTDAAINPGNSGGALVDLEGELVGINTAIFSRSGGSQGIGFAIPASMVSAVVDAILEDGEVERGFLGVQIADLSPDQRSELGIEGGAWIAEVQRGTPAARAGLLPGDVVLDFQGEGIPDAARFRNRVAAQGADVPFAATVLRQGERTVVRGVLGELLLR
ncbi:MAG TPA: trypsin-like serine protease [Deltaproteobacteria bacterium]|nr:trypsin-like serine protease [Deltaproteobacteria bacterium]